VSENKFTRQTHKYTCMFIYYSASH